MISPQKKKKIVPGMRDEYKKAFYRTPGKSSYPLPEKKNFGRPPRELQCSDRAQTSTTGSGRASCIDVVSGFWLKVLVRRDKFENRRKNHNYTYTYIYIENSKTLKKLQTTKREGPSGFERLKKTRRKNEVVLPAVYAAPFILGETRD